MWKQPDQAARSGGRESRFVFLLPLFSVLVMLAGTLLEARPPSSRGEEHRADSVLSAGEERITGRSLSPHLTARYHGLTPAEEYLRVSLVFAHDPGDDIGRERGVLTVAGRGRHRDLLIPAERAGEILAAWEGLAEIRDRQRPIPQAVTGQQVGLFQTSLFLDQGFDGRGVRVGVIDGGFNGYQNAVSAGELPGSVRVVSFGLTAADHYDDEDSKHGTAVAEVVHETAPAAELHLIKIDSFSGLFDALDYLREKDIRIVNFSMGWFTDGWTAEDSDAYNLIVLPYYRSGGLWINSAGNYAQRHYQSLYRDNGSGRHDFSGGFDYGRILNVTAGQPIRLIMTWDAFQEKKDGLHFADYDLELFDPDGVSVAQSSLLQPQKWPIESIDYTAGKNGAYRYKVKKINTAQDKHFQVYSLYHDLNPVTRSNSLIMPAEGRHVLAVGAVHHTNWNKSPAQVQATYYSSRGPSKTGLRKPDLVGVAGMANYTYGVFNGTSASAPSVTGLAALLLSKQPYLTPYQLHYTLVDNCEDIWKPGPDSETGYGKPGLTFFPLRRNTDHLTNAVIVAPTRLRSGERLYYYGVTDDTIIHLKTASGHLVGSFAPRKGVYPTAEHFLDFSDLRLAEGVYVLEFRDPLNPKTRQLRKIVVTR